MSTLISYNGLEVISPEPSALGGKAINDNFKKVSTKISASSNPDSSNDSLEGYSEGSRWFNQLSNTEFLCTDASTGAAEWVKISPTSATTSITYAASITPDSNVASVINVGTLTGNITINNPSGAPLDAQALTFRFVIDSTGGRAVTWGSAYVFGTDIVSGDLPQSANSKFEILFRYNAPDSKWRALALARGF